MNYLSTVLLSLNNYSCTRSVMSENVGLVCNRRRYRLVVRTPDCGSGNLSSNLSTVNFFIFLNLIPTYPNNYSLLFPLKVNCLHFAASSTLSS